MNKSQFKDPLRLAQLYKHKTLDAMIISLSPTGGIFFAAVKLCNVDIAISGNFVLNAKKT